jgi:hypothetical protein
MAAVSVFVDDAIQGRLPRVCAKTGEPSDLTIRIRQPVGAGLPAIVWLLLLFGPFGLIGVAILAMVLPGQEYLTVRIPETDESFERERQLERWRLAALGAGVFVPLLGVLLVRTSPALWLALGAGFLVIAGILHVTHWRQSIGVSIDVTRRWVTLTNVHPRFVAAVEWQEVTSRH